MAAYMLFHVFIALFLFMRSERVGMRLLYGALALVFAFLLVLTATRGAIIGLVGGILYTVRNTAYIQQHPIWSRIASISLSAGATRFTIWSIALEGVKERSLLGWGQSNFDYVFERYYEPSLYAQEPWFDRVHNIVLDWLIAAGIVGLLSYLFLLATPLYYVVVRPFLHTDDRLFSVPERGILLGLMAGYFVHNLVVFDNLISYLLF